VLGLAAPNRIQSKPTGMATREGRTISVTEKKRINA
jgi:hypothetical protein